MELKPKNLTGIRNITTTRSTVNQVEVTANADGKVLVVASGTAVETQAAAGSTQIYYFTCAGTVSAFQVWGSQMHAVFLPD